MGLIKTILAKLAELENKNKILEGKIKGLTIKTDLINSTSKELPDRTTYKPQEPYLGGVGVKLTKIFEQTILCQKPLGDSDTWYEYFYLQKPEKLPVYLWVAEVESTQIYPNIGTTVWKQVCVAWNGTRIPYGTYGSGNTYPIELINNQLKFTLGMSWNYNQVVNEIVYHYEFRQNVHWTLYTVDFDFGEWTII